MNKDWKKDWFTFESDIDNCLFTKCKYTINFCHCNLYCSCNHKIEGGNPKKYL